jgi:hypothetical protein
MKIRPVPILVSLIGASALSGSAVLAQYEYHYSYGNSRVVQQDSIGLERPSGSYIGTGTLSKSAQGALQTGPLVNPGLPRVNAGSFVGTPGDNMYGAHPIYSPAEEQKQKVEVWQQQRQRRLQMIRQQPQPQNDQPKGFLYQPGENLKAGSGAFMTYPSSDSSATSSGPAIYNPQALDSSSPSGAQPPKASSRRY